MLLKQGKIVTGGLINNDLHNDLHKQSTLSLILLFAVTSLAWRVGQTIEVLILMNDAHDTCFVSFRTCFLCEALATSSCYVITAV